jgi:hypothetical protein
LDAEILFHDMKQLMIESAPEKAESRRVVEKDLIKELRSVLDCLLELQADSAPNDIIERSVRGGEGLFPRREGSMMDTLFARQYSADEDVEMDDAEPEVDNGDVPQANRRELELVKELEELKL